LSAKLERSRDPPVSSCKKPIPASSRIELGLPKKVILEIMGAKQLIVLEYIIEQLMQRVGSKSCFKPP